MTARLAGKVAIVSAAASGIGLAVAKKFIAEGVAVMCCLDRSPAVRDIAAGLGRQGVVVEGTALDLTSRAQVEREFAEIHARHARIDILVNGVGSSARDKVSEFADSDPATWEWVIETSLKSAMLASRQVLARMREQRGGRIVCVSTDAWLYPARKFVDYAAAKAGVVGFVRGLALEEAPHGITVNAVSPGPVRAGGTAQLPPDMLARIVEEVPLGRMGEPEDVANLIAFLASEEAGWITGQNIAINGGRTMQ